LIASSTAHLPPKRRRVAESLIGGLKRIVDKFMKKPDALGRLQNWQFSGEEEGGEVQLHGEEQVVQGCTRGMVAVEEEMFIQLAGGSAEAPGAPYNDQYRRLHTNINLNEYLAMDIYLGHVSAREVALMTGDDMLSQEARKEAEATRRAAREATQLDWMKKHRSEILESAGLTSGLGKPCKKCRGTNTQNTQKQTRSGDEPMTMWVFVS
jgi:DNA-directed RNA polymerase subunit M/transcription elongation factor TFIIS